MVRKKYLSNIIKTNLPKGNGVIEQKKKKVDKGPCKEGLYFFICSLAKDLCERVDDSSPA
jgi:hypothetical protein